MSVSLITSPNLYSPVYGNIWIQLSSASSSVTDFKYIIDVNSVDMNSSVTTFIDEFKIPPRPINGNGLFSPNKLLASQLSYNVQPYITVASTASNSIMKYNFNYGSQYNPGWSMSLSASGSNTQGVAGISFSYMSVGDIITISLDNQQFNGSFNGTASITSVFTVGGTQGFLINKPWVATSSVSPVGLITQIRHMETATSSNFYGFNGTRQYNQPITYDFSNYVVFDATASTSISALTNINTQHIYTSNYETISMLIDTMTQSGSPTSSLWIDVRKYDVNGVDLGHNYLQKVSTIFPNIKYRRYDFPIGPQNCIDGALGGMTFSGVNYYVLNVNSVTGASVSTSLYRKTYYIVDNCSPYSNIRIAFVNRLGGVDYFNFNRKNVNSLNISRTEFKKVLPYDYVIGDRQDSILATKANEMYSCSTDWITENESIWLKELLTSPEVYWVDDAGLKTPIIVTDSSYTVKTYVTDKLFCLEMNFRVANDIQLQNQ